MKELIVAAKIEQLDEVIEFVAKELEKHELGMKMEMQIAVVVEEIFVNIAHYAYNFANKEVTNKEVTNKEARNKEAINENAINENARNKEATIRCLIDEESLQVTIQFLDSGKPFNPLLKQDPDISLSAEERDIGGLGVFMVKKMMDTVNYEYKEGKNILTIKKKI